MSSNSSDRPFGGNVSSEVGDNDGEDIDREKQIPSTFSKPSSHTSQPLKPETQVVQC